MATLISQFNIRDDFILDLSLVLYLPLYELDGASFMSKDAYGHQCTVTGAIWRPNGRYFDKTDDKVVIPHHASLNVTTGDFSVGAWADLGGDVTNLRYLISKCQGGIGIAGWGIYFGQTTGAFSGFLHDGTTDIYLNDGVNHSNTGFHFYFMTVDKSKSDGWKLWVDGEIAKMGNASSLGSLSSTPAVHVGMMANGSNYSFDGPIGEVFEYKRCLTPLEIKHIYLATKWRYR